MTIHREQLIQILLKEFPSLQEELADEIWEGLLYLEVAYFARYTQEQIESQNKDEASKCFNR